MLLLLLLLLLPLLLRLLQWLLLLHLLPLLLRLLHRLLLHTAAHGWSLCFAAFLKRQQMSTHLLVFVGGECCCVAYL